MRWCIELTDGSIAEVVHLFDEKGDDTEEVFRADSIVYAHPAGCHFTTLIPSPAVVHPVQ